MENKKFILHFDARNTLFVADMSYRLTIEEALNCYITGIVWGQLTNEPNVDKLMNKNSQLNNDCSFETKCYKLIENKNIPKNKKEYFNNPTKSNSPHIFEDSKQNSDESHACTKKEKRTKITLTENKTTDETRIPYSGENFTNLNNEELIRFKTTSAYWHCLEDSPCIKQPRHDAISIYKMLERQIVKTPADRGRLRKYLGNFTQTPEGLPFLKIFTQHLEMLCWPNQPKGDIQQLEKTNNLGEPKLTVMGKNKKLFHYLMPAFFHLLTWLLENKYDFAIFIRTYGKDGPSILSAIEAYLDGSHPLEKIVGKNKFNVDHTIWRVKRSDENPKFNFYNQINGNDQNSLIELKTPKEIYDLWSSWNGAVSIVDDFNYWQSHEYMQKSAKPFWIDPTDQHIQHILFDDNIRFEDDGSNGIDLHYLDNSEEGSHSLEPDEAMKWENVYFVQADLLSIIQDKNYFIKKVEECHNNLNEIQKQSKLQIEEFQTSTE